MLGIVCADLDVYGDMESQFCNGGMGVWWGLHILGIRILENNAVYLSSLFFYFNFI